MTLPTVIAPAPVGTATDAARDIGVGEIPRVDDPTTVGAADARAMSKVLFARLRVLEEGTHEYQYVRNTLVELNLPLVRYVAGRFRSRSESVEEMVQVGTIGLIKAIDRFDAAHGVEFPTFAIPTISGEIKRFFRDTSWSVHVPRRLQELRLELAKAREAYTTEHDREPTSAELAELLGLSVREVDEGLIASAGYSAASLDAPAPDDDGSAPAYAARAAFVEPGYTMTEDLVSLRPLIAALPAREREILALRFGEEMTQSQIGERLGISQMHVSRLISRTVTTLRTQLLAD